MKLNIGSNKWKKEGWINVDIDPVVEPDVVADCTALPFESGTIDEIYAGHVLEHLEKMQCRIALKEFKRVLRKGGRLHVVIPDISVAYDLFMRGISDWGLLELIAFGDPKERDAQAHKQLYCEEELLKDLECSGFSNPRPLNYDDKNLPIIAKVIWQTGVTVQKPTK